MKQFSHSPFAGQLEVVATLRDRQIEASLAELKRRDEVTLALRQSLRNGVPIDELSNASGLTPREIRSRVDAELCFGEDLEALVGSR